MSVEVTQQLDRAMVDDLFGGASELSHCLRPARHALRSPSLPAGHVLSYCRGLHFGRSTACPACTATLVRALLAMPCRLVRCCSAEARDPGRGIPQGEWGCKQWCETR